MDVSIKEKHEILKNSSPLYNYWRSSQDEDEENKRLLKVNDTNHLAILFKKEPYKWENLYQSIAREILRGDQDSLKGLRITLDCLNQEEKNNIINFYKEKKLFDITIINQIKSGGINEGKTKNNSFRFLRILLAIFTNPYGLELRRKKNHIYEYSGYYLHELRKLIFKGSDLF